MEISKRVEKFISDCTRNCSNEIIGGGWNNGEFVQIFNPWLTPDQARKAVEIAREEVREQLWVDADSDNLPSIDKDVIALEGLGDGDYKVVFAHRISPDNVIRTSIDGKPMELHPKRYGKAGWNLPDIKYWLNVELSKRE